MSLLSSTNYSDRGPRQALPRTHYAIILLMIIAVVVWGIELFNNRESEKIEELKKIDGLGAVAGEQILAHHAKVEIQEDLTILVTETISFSTTAERKRHGIRRSLPNLALGVGLQGPEVPLRYEVISLSDDAGSRPWNLNRSEHGSMLALGDLDHPLEPGEHTFHLNYRVSNAVITSGVGTRKLAWVLSPMSTYTVRKGSMQVTFADGRELSGVKVKAGARFLTSDSLGKNEYDEDKPSTEPKSVGLERDEGNRTLTIRALSPILVGMSLGFEMEFSENVESSSPQAQ